MGEKEKMTEQMTREWSKYLKLMQERPHEFRDCNGMEIVTDPDEVRKFEQASGQTIGVVYQSPYSIMVVDLVHEKDGRPFAYERLMPAAVGSAVVCVTRQEENYILLKQLRHSLRGEQIGFPRGYGENGVSAEDNARKEIYEELGGEVLELKPLGKVVADSGIGGAAVEVFECKIDTWELKKGYEGIAEVLVLTEQELEQQIENGTINDGYTLAAFTLLGIKNKRNGCSSVENRKNLRSGMNNATGKPKQ